MSQSMYSSGYFLFKEEPEDSVWSAIKEILEIDWIPEEGWKPGASYIMREKYCGDPQEITARRSISFSSYDHNYHGNPEEIREQLKQFLPFIEDIHLWFTYLEDSDFAFTLQDLQEET